MNRNSLKRLACLLLIFAAIISVAGCSGDQQQSTDVSNTGNGTISNNGGTEILTMTFCMPSYSPNDMMGTYASMITAAIEDAFPGRIDVQEITPGTFGGEWNTIEAVQAGSIDFTAAADMSYDIVTGTMAWPFIPYIYTTYEAVDENYYQGWVHEEITKAINDMGLVRVGDYEGGFRNLATVDGYLIETVDDLKGLKVRTPTSTQIMPFYEAIGCLPAGLDSSEVVTALEQGVVVGQDNTIPNFEVTGTLDITTNVFMMNYLYNGGSAVCSLNFWSKLTEEEQAKFMEVCQKTGREWIQIRRDYEDNLVQERVDTGLMKVTYPDDEMNAYLKECAKIVWKQMESSIDSAIMERIYKDFG